MWTNAQYQQKNQHHKWMKTMAYDLRLMVEWSGEQHSTQCLSGSSAFRMCWPFRSKSNPFRVLWKHGFLLILRICLLFYVQDCSETEWSFSLFFFFLLYIYFVCYVHLIYNIYLISKKICRQKVLSAKIFRR